MRPDGTYRSFGLSGKNYKDRLKKGGWILYGSFRASKVIAGRTALMFMRRAAENRDVVICRVMWRSSSAAIHGAWRTDSNADTDVKRNTKGYGRSRSR
jgi:hypothetical protein